MKIIKGFRKNFKIGSLFGCEMLNLNYKKNSIVKSCFSLSFFFICSTKRTGYLVWIHNLHNLT